MHDTVTCYGINYGGWDANNAVGLRKKELIPVQLDFPFVLKVPLCNLRPSIIYSVPCDLIVQTAY